jgi:hypothetical protein
MAPFLSGFGLPTLPAIIVPLVWHLRLSNFGPTEHYYNICQSKMAAFNTRHTEIYSLSIKETTIHDVKGFSEYGKLHTPPRLVYFEIFVVFVARI